MNLLSFLSVHFRCNYFLREDHQIWRGIKDKSNAVTPSPGNGGSYLHFSSTK